MKILYAEDHRIMREAMKVFLEVENFEVYAFRNGAEALWYLTQHPDQVDLLLTDNKMPVMRGMELTKKARESGFKGPIILISMDRIEQEALEAGANRFVDKGSSPLKLVKVIRELTEGVEAR